MSDAQDTLLAWLEKWYTDQCDGEWEHEYGVKITTLDNPGWLIKLSVGDALDGRFEPIADDEGDDRWLFAKVDAGTLQIACDAHSLRRALALARELLSQ